MAVPVETAKRSLAIASILSGNLAAAHAALSAEITRCLGGLGLTIRPRDCAMIRLLSLTAGNSDVADLSNFLSMSPTATRQILGGLESLGWVTSVPSAEDRRFRHWRVTEQATAALSKAPRFDRNFALAATLEKLGAAGRAALSNEFL